MSAQIVMGPAILRATRIYRRRSVMSKYQLYIYFFIVSSCPTCCTTNTNSLLFWWKERKVDPPVIACTVHNWPAQGVHAKLPLRLRYLYTDFNSGNSGFWRNNLFLFLVHCVVDDAIDLFYVCASKCTFLLLWPVSTRFVLPVASATNARAF